MQISGSETMTKLNAALRAKFKSPKDALKALGLDESILTDHMELVMANKTAKLSPRALPSAEPGAMGGTQCVDELSGYCGGGSRARCGRHRALAVFAQPDWLV